MRLLKAIDQGGFSLHDFHDSLPPYAILSHTWEANDQEVKLEDIRHRSGLHKTGYKKIEFCAQQARKDGLDYFWVDSCCINQDSSAELTEAINSMFRWYQDAVKCYVYMADVSATEIPTASSSGQASCFVRSRWFTRGWTLQELLAPNSVGFFNKDGVCLGDKVQLRDLIQQATGISNQILEGQPPTLVGIEERLSWIANRNTTKSEDTIYSVLGIFEAFMPPIYGEGAVNAFRRLAEEIEKSSAFAQPRRSNYRTSKYVELTH